MLSDDSKARSLAALAGIVIAGILLRQAGVENWSYWLDEAMQVSYVRGSLKELWGAVRFDGVHPPLDYVLTWVAYHVGGGRERILRLVPTLWLTLAVLTAYLSAGGARRPVRSLGAAAFLAATPLGVYLGQEVRPYALAIFLVTLAFALLEDDQAVTSDWARESRTLLASAVSALAVMTLYLALVPLLVLWLSSIWRARTNRRELVATSLCALPPVLAWVGWIWSVRSALVRPAEARFAVDLSFHRVLALLNGLLGWRDENPHLLIGVLVPALLVLLGLVVCYRAGEHRYSVALIATTLGVVLALAVRGHWLSVRYLALALVPCSVLFGRGFECLFGSRPGASYVVIAGFIALHSPSYLEIYRSARPDWRQVASYLAYQAERGRHGRILGLDDWSYLCLRAQPLIAHRVEGILAMDRRQELLRGEGWLIRTPHYHGSSDFSVLLGDIRPWGRAPAAEDARIYRFRDGRVLPP